MTRRAPTAAAGRRQLRPRRDRDGIGRLRVGSVHYRRLTGQRADRAQGRSRLRRRRGEDAAGERRNGRVSTRDLRQRGNYVALEVVVNFHCSDFLTAHKFDKQREQVRTYMKGNTCGPSHLGS